jgi:predicted  nucleic acid-binding Zn-ribbon protein
MILRDLREAVAKLAHLHPLTETGIEGLSPMFGYVVAETYDMTGVADELEEALKEKAKLETEVDELGTQIDTLNDELADAQNLLAEVKNEDDKGATILSYKKRAEQAEETVTKWRPAYGEMQRELTALRKRKGLEAGYVGAYRDVMVYLHNSKDPAAQAIVTKIHASK